MSSSKTENRNAPNADEIRIVPVSETFHHINEERKIDVDDGAVIRSSKEKLNEFLEKSDFELLMRERAKVRKEKDEHSVAELKIQMSNMERALAAEIKRRIEMNKSVQEKCQAKIQEMDTKFQELIDNRTEQILSRIKSLDMRLDSMRYNFEDNMQQSIPRKIEETSEQLHKMLHDFNEEFQREKRDRLNREGRIIQQLADHEMQAKNSLDAERSSRDDKISELRQILQSNEDGRIDADSKFSKLIEKEFRSLRHLLASETRERKTEDDEIVEALNRYTSKLQKSLAVVSAGVD